MNVASLKLSKELYKLSGWGGSSVVYGVQWQFQVKIDKRPALYTRTEMDEAEGYSIDEIAPAYDLGYLLRKLPDVSLTKTLSKDAPARLGNYTMYPYPQRSFKPISADTAEDCAAKLAIELIRQGVIKP